LEQGDVVYSQHHNILGGLCWVEHHDEVTINNHSPLGAAPDRGRSLQCRCCRWGGEEYSWNKATSCIHNILGGLRWVEHHGEVTISNRSLGITAKILFTKVPYLQQFARFLSYSPRVGQKSEATNSWP